MRYPLAFAVAALFSLSFGNSAFAGAGVTSSPSSCTSLNCGAASITGTILTPPSTSGGPKLTLPFTTQIFVNTGNCLRLDVTAQGDDMEMVVVATDGTVWRNDDRSGSLLPLVIIPSAPSSGWYTVQIANYSANNGNQANVTLRYGRYTASTNPNCSPGTPAF